MITMKPYFSKTEVILRTAVRVDEKYIIRKYLGIPFKHQGRSLDGLDCWGLIKMIYKDLGYDLFDLDNYACSRNWQGVSYFIENYWREWSKIDEPRIFDGVLFKNLKGLAVHCGIVLSDNKFMHCVEKAGVVINNLSDIRFQPNIEGFYRLKVLDD